MPDSKAFTKIKEKFQKKYNVKVYRVTKTEGIDNEEDLIERITVLTTERKYAEERMEDSQRMYDMLRSNFWMDTSTGNLVWLNFFWPSYNNILGLMPELKLQKKNAPKLLVEALNICFFIRSSGTCALSDNEEWLEGDRFENWFALISMTWRILLRESDETLGICKDFGNGVVTSRPRLEVLVKEMQNYCNEATTTYRQDQGMAVMFSIFDKEGSLLDIDDPLVYPPPPPKKEQENEKGKKRKTDLEEPGSKKQKIDNESSRSDVNE